MYTFHLTLTIYIRIIYDDFLYNNTIDKFIYNSLTLFQVLEDENSIQDQAHLGSDHL